MCKAVPDGVVAFFPSYLYMESIVAAWNDMVSKEDVYAKRMVLRSSSIRRGS